MLRYVAFCWSPMDVGQASAVAALERELLDERRLATRGEIWRRVVSQSGLHVFVSNTETWSSRCIPLAGREAVIFGTLFPKPSERPAADDHIGRINEIGEAESHAIVHSRGRHLVESYWGDYVAIGQEGGEFWVLRGPQGRLPCLHASVGGMTVLFSYCPDWLALKSGNCSTDLVSVAQWVCGGNSRERTGFQEIQQLPSGWCLAQRGSHLTREPYWRPAEVALLPALEDPDDASRRLRGIVEACTEAWASCFQSVLVRLSGGLDSSVVLGSLHRARVRPRVTCVTRYTQGIGDERRYARAAAAHSGCELEEHELRSDLRLESMLAVQARETPETVVAASDVVEWEEEVAARCSATAKFDGCGGDWLFFNSVATLALADLNVAAGRGRAEFRFAMNVARGIGWSVWRALHVAHQAANGSESTTQAERSLIGSLVTPRFVELVRARELSSSETVTRHGTLLPGKRFHVKSLGTSGPYYPTFPRCARMQLVSPLMSQPVVEIGLRIPTYVLMLSGYSRGLARLAFASHLPPLVRNRFDKGGPDEQIADLLRRNREALRAILLTGRLVDEGIVFPDRLDDSLSEMPTGAAASLLELLTCLNVEIWLRASRSALGQAAAAA